MTTSDPPFDSSSPDEPNLSYPPRFRRLKRWTAFVVMAVVALLSLRLWWGHEAQRRRDAEITAAHARGERILPEDFWPAEPLADADNAATLILEAGSALKWPTPLQEWENQFDGPPLQPRDIQAIRQLLEVNRQPLRLVRAARGRPQSDFGMRPKSPVASALLPWLNPTRELAQILRYGGEYHLARGDDAAAVEDVLDVLRLQRAMDGSAPAMICHMVASGIGALASVSALEIAGAEDDVVTAKRRTPRAAPAATRPADRARLAALIQQLLDESQLDDAMNTAWQGERMMVMDWGPQLLKMQPRPIAWTLSPMYELDALRGLSFATAQGAAARTLNFPAAMTLTPNPIARSDHMSELQSVTRVVSTFGGAYGRTGWHRQEFRARCDRRAAATALAIRLYVADHHALPPALDALVPAYLPCVPRDPFASGNQPLRYIADPRDPRLYSVGEDGIDQQASTRPAGSAARRTGSRNYRWDRQDAVYLLPPLLPSDQAN